MALYRATQDRWIFGVCGGIGHRYRVNTNVVRLITAVVAILPGVTLPLVGVVYLAMGLLLPETQEY